MRTIHPLGLIVAGALALAACGGAGAAPPAAPTAAAPTAAAATGPVSAPAGSIEVHLADFMITPAAISASGPQVEFFIKNDGPTPHNLFVRDATGRILIHSGTLNPGQTQVVSGNLPAGSYITYCALPGHESLGMHGTLTIG